MKRLLTPLLAISLLSSTAVMAQPSRPDNHGQSEKGDKEKQDKQKQDSKKQAAKQRTTQQQADRQRATPQRTAQQQAAKPRETPQRTTQQQAEKQRATPQRTAQQQAERQRATPQRTTQQQARKQDTTTQRPVVQQRATPQRAEQQRTTTQVATQRWSRGDRLPDQYRQNRYAVNNWQYYSLQAPPRGYRWYRSDNNDFFLVLLATGVISNSIFWQDRDRSWNQRYRRSYAYDDDVYYRQCRNGPDPAGILAGALIGGLFGNAAGHGDRTNATIAGIIIGGSVGAALTSHMDCGDRSYAYRVYSNGFNRGRVNYPYNWYNPRSGHRGTFMITRYYYDQDGFRCANYRQSLRYVRTRDRDMRGRACLQPNGAWVIVG